MAISPDTIERVRQAADIVDVIGSYVPLKRSGANYKALSPFNKEKTPSFYVNPDKQMFKCFSSGHGGDVFKFVMLYENLDFPAAVRRIAERVGIEIQEERSPEFSKEKRRRDRLLTLHSEVMARWRQMLLHDPAAKHARDYMHAREIPLSWVEEFDLGYARAEWDDVVKWALGKGYEESELVESGLALRHERGRVYDRFRDRLVFAIHDDRGQTVAFSARSLSADAKEAKYINSPETPIFNKGRVLFGFHRAKRPILDADAVVLCEGQIDVLRCHATGIGNVVAPLGTAFTRDHAAVIARQTRNVILCLDADTAGQRAATRAADTLLAAGDAAEVLVTSDIGIRVVRLPSGHDPDSLIREEGVEALRGLLNAPMEYIDFLVDRAGLDAEGDGPSAKRKQARTAAEFLAKVPNTVLREQLLMRAALRMDVSAEALERELEQLPKKARSMANPPKRVEPRTPAAGVESRAYDSPEPPDVPVEGLMEDEEAGLGSVVDSTPPVLSRWVAELLILFLADSSLIPDTHSYLPWDELQAQDGAGLLRKVVEAHGQELWQEEEDLAAILSPGERRALNALSRTGMGRLTRDQMAGAVRDIGVALRSAALQERMRTIKMQIRQPGVTLENRKALLAQLEDLIKLKMNLTTP